MNTKCLECVFFYRYQFEDFQTSLYSPKGKKINYVLGVVGTTDGWTVNCEDHSLDRPNLFNWKQTKDHFKLAT